MAVHSELRITVTVHSIPSRITVPELRCQCTQFDTVTVHSAPDSGDSALNSNSGEFRAQGAASLGDDGLTCVAATRDRIADFAALLGAAEDAEEAEAIARLRRADSIGRPIGNAAFLERLETSYDRRLRRAKPGPQRREQLSALSP